MSKVQYCLKEIFACLLTFFVVYILKDAGIKKYFVLLSVSILFFIYGYRKFDKDYLVFALPPTLYVVFGLLMSLFNGNFTYQSVKEIAFAGVPLIAGISFFMASKRANVDFIKWMYWSMVVLTVYCLRYYYIEDVTETQYAFIFGVFLLYFCIVKRNIKYTIFKTVMLYLMNKRIAMLAAVAILVLYDSTLWIVKKKPEWRHKMPRWFSVGATLIFCGYVLGLCVVNLEGQFIQDLTSGRSSAWNAVKEYYQLSVFWPGKGLGDVVNLLGILQFPSFTTNLHNDLLKVFAEIGLIGYVLWLASHFIMCKWISQKRELGYKKTIFLYLVVIYSLLNYMTDNIMVYVNYWFPAYLVLLTVVFVDDQKEVEQNEDKKDHILLLGVILVFGICILADVAKIYADYKDPSKFTIPEDAVEIYSPDGGTTRITVWLREGQPYYRVRYGGENLIEPSVLGIKTSEYAMEKKVTFENVVFGDVVDETVALTDNDDPLKTSYQPVWVTMKKDGYQLTMEVRLYDYGVAFRYVLPDETELVDELTQIRFLSGCKVDIYDETAGMDMSEISAEELEATVYQMPFLAKYVSGSLLKISEVTQKGEKNSYVTSAKGQDRTLDIEFYSLINYENVEKNCTPWRVFEVIR